MTVGIDAYETTSHNGDDEENEKDKQSKRQSDDNSGMISIPFILITIVSKVVDPRTPLTIISIC